MAESTFKNMFIFEFDLDSLASKTASLIVDKIMAPAETPRISRPRLLAMLEQSLASCTSTVVSGRAGSGKTALAVDFARSCGRRVAWYKVEAPECEPKIFFKYLIASIQTQRPDFGKKALMPVAKTAQLDQIPLLAEAFVYELEGENKPLLMVIEDLHLVCDSEWLVPFLRHSLPLLPPEVHVLITSRTLPPAPLWRMRSKQTLSVIDEQLLAFNISEAVELFESYGLSSQQANASLDHAHGRAAALMGFAATLSNHNDGEASQCMQLSAS